MTRKIHGNARSSDGYLVTRKYYLLDDQEAALGQSYLGLFGFAISAVVIAYVLIFYGYPGGGRGGRFGIQFASFADMPTEIQILLPIAIAGHLIALISGCRLVLHWNAISGQPRSDIEN